MRLVVDEIPKDRMDCVFSTYDRYLEQHECKLRGNELCMLQDGKCPMLATIQEINQK